MVLDGKTGAVWCWTVRQVQCGAEWLDRCNVVLDLLDRCSVVLNG